MSKPMIFLSNTPIRYKSMSYPKNVSYEWDGESILTTYVQGQALRITELHFQPGDAVLVSQQDNIIKFSRVTEPQKMSMAVLWLIGVNKSVRTRSEGDFEFRVSEFTKRHRVESPDEGVLEEIRWSPMQRVNLTTCKGPWLFQISEPGLRIARYAKLTGNKWVDVAAWCSPNMKKEDAIGFIRKYAGKVWPSWYIEKVLTNAEMVRKIWLENSEAASSEP